MLQFFTEAWVLAEVQGIDLDAVAVAQIVGDLGILILEVRPQQFLQVGIFPRVAVPRRKRLERVRQQRLWG